MIFLRRMFALFRTWYFKIFLKRRITKNMAPTITVKQLEAIGKTYNDIKNEVVDLSDYEIAIEQHPDRLFIHYFPHKETYSNQIIYGFSSEYPGITYEMDMESNEIIKIIYMR